MGKPQVSAGSIPASFTRTGTTAASCGLSSASVISRATVREYTGEAREVYHSGLAKKQMNRPPACAVSAGKVRGGGSTPSEYEKRDERVKNGMIQKNDGGINYDNKRKRKTNL